MSTDHEKGKKMSFLEEVGYLNMLQQEALIRILVQKGVFTEEELLETVKVIHEESEASGKN
ncbi:MAG: hypothetical protein ACOC0U_00570 [Desulfovibrionales bacterium]